MDKKKCFGGFKNKKPRFFCDGVFSMCVFLFGGRGGENGELERPRGEVMGR